MIDSMYQDAINRNLDDQVRRPAPAAPPQGPSAFTGFWRGLGGLVAGPLEGAAALSEETGGFGQVMGATGTMTGGGMFALPTDKERAEANAAHNKLMTEGLDMNTPEGAAMRAKAKEFMPDPTTTGTAGKILAGASSFMTQAVPATMAGPAGLVQLGMSAGLSESDKLREQGVDENTRTAAGAVAGVAAAGSMLLPMSGATRLIRFGKGAAGGAGSVAAQAEAEKLILQHAGYDKLADQYDPLDPVNLAVAAVVPGILGAALGHTPAGKLREPNAEDVGFTPAEAAHAQSVEHLDTNIADLQREIASQKDEGAKAVLQAELDKLQTQRRAGVAETVADDPNLQAAARVSQSARALDESRLTPDEDVVGLEQHQRALEQAADQIASGQPVNVSDVFGDSLFDRMRDTRALADRIDYLEGQRASLLGDAGNALEPGEVAALRQQIAEAQSQLVDAGPAAVKARAKELQGENVSYKQATARAQRELSERLVDQQSTIDRLQQRLDQHAAAAQASGRISFVDRDLEAARERAASMPGPATTPRRLSIAVANAIREMREEPAPAATKPNREAFHAAAREAEAAKAGETAAGGAAEPAGRSAPAAPRAAAAPERAPAGPADPHLDAAVAALDPDMLVHLDGEPNAVRLGDMMDRLRTEAAEQGRDAKLLEVAAQCALSFPAAA